MTMTARNGTSNQVNRWWATFLDDRTLPLTLIVLIARTMMGVAIMALLFNYEVI